MAQLGNAASICWLLSIPTDQHTMDVEIGDVVEPKAAVDDPGGEAAAAKIWAVYVSEAEKYHKGLVESWQSDMEGMLIFASLMV
ncbi:hypothetical protein C8R44DRAFT_795356 [Mycena epipterygia]|nr:hypothetical protein C8R44DRAFT_795356 [Mycena epipterygia]